MVKFIIKNLNSINFIKSNEPITTYDVARGILKILSKNFDYDKVLGYQSLDLPINLCSYDGGYKNIFVDRRGADIYITIDYVAIDDDVFEKIKLLPFNVEYSNFEFVSKPYRCIPYKGE